MKFSQCLSLSKESTGLSGKWSCLVTKLPQINNLNYNCDSQGFSLKVFKPESMEMYFTGFVSFMIRCWKNCLSLGNLVGSWRISLLLIIGINRPPSLEGSLEVSWSAARCLLSCSPLILLICWNYGIGCFKMLIWKVPLSGVRKTYQITWWAW